MISCVISISTLLRHQNWKGRYRVNLTVRRQSSQNRVDGTITIIWFTLVYSVLNIPVCVVSRDTVTIVTQHSCLRGMDPVIY